MVKLFFREKFQMQYSELLQTVASRYKDNSIKKDDIPFIQTILNKDSVIALLEDIIKNPELLQKISERSYTHALGFDKIVLVDLSKDLEQKYQKTQVRLHIWNPLKTNALPIVESLHEHSFDFISTILSGHLENQQFSLSEMTPEMQVLLDKLLNVIPNLSSEDLKFVNDQIEILEAIGLLSFGSEQLVKMKMHQNYDLYKLRGLLHMTSEEVFALNRIEGHYVSNRVPGEKKAYKHVLKDYVLLKGHNVLKLNKGDYYFHPYQLPHRLYYDNTILNSTILVTTPVPNNPEGGSLQRPTYVQSGEQSYDKISFSIDSFKETLVNYLDYLRNQG
jgi:hypothetical protein